MIGLETTERVAGRFVFMSFGAEHHDLALQQIRGRWGSTFAVGVDGERELADAIDRLEQAGVPYWAVDHGISKAVYLSDPYGHGIEIYCDARSARGGVTRPLDPATLRRDTQGLGFQGRHQGGDPVASRGSTGQQSAIAGV